MTHAEAVDWLFRHRRLDPETSCWVYTEDTTHDGKYGRVSHNSVIAKWAGETLVHRISAKVFCGFEGGGRSNKLVHVCGNTLCFNYDHLRHRDADRVSCEKCGTEYLVSEDKFYGPYAGRYETRGGYHPWCKPCWKAYYAANAARFSQLSKAWRKANPERVSLARRQRGAQIRAGRVGHVHYKKILARDDWTCHICGFRVESLDDLHFDHIIPLAKGGEHSENNIAVSHATCNMRKHTSVVPSRLQQLRLGIEVAT